MKPTQENTGRRHEIESSAIQELIQTGKSVFHSDAEDTSIMIGRVVELLFEEQRSQHKILYLATFEILKPEISFKGKKLHVTCEVNITHPVKIQMVFSYSLKNSKEKGQLAIDTFNKVTIKLKDNRLKNRISKQLLQHFDVVATTKEILEDLNNVLVRILVADHGEKCNLKSVELKINAQDITISLSSK